MGLVLGQIVLSGLKSDTFRRLCMATDALLVGFGLARTALGLQLMSAAAAYAGLALVGGLEVLLVWRYFRGQPAQAEPRPTPGAALDYPVALKLAGRSVLLVGAGRVGEARLSALLDAGALCTWSHPR